MADVFTPSQRSRIMAAVRSKGNRSTELALAAVFRACHITGWRRQYPVAGKPDFAFPHAKLAVFVDGCFWHGCPRCGSIPATHRPYWKAKIARNIQRDRAQAKELRLRGWSVVRIWEHHLRGSAVRRVVNRIKTALARQLAKR